MSDTPEVQEFPGAAATRVAGAMVIGGSWEGEPAATEEKPALPDPFDY
jgi:hypothetical protein